MGYVGSEEFIRLQFEEYLLSLISSVKCHSYLTHHAHNPKAQLPQVDGDPTQDFGTDWVDAWTRTENYRIWEGHTDSHLFDVVEPKHPCAGGLTIDDVQRRIAEQVKEFHLDERFAVGKEALGRNLQAGREKASTVFNRLYADMEALRETQRRKHEEQKRDGSASPGFQGPDLNGAKQTVQSVGSKAGAYIGSWGAWVGEKRKTGWGRSASGNNTTTTASTSKKDKDLPTLPIRDEKPPPPATPSDVSNSVRPKSYNENLFDADLNGVHEAQAREIKPLPSHPSKFHEEIDIPAAIEKDVPPPAPPAPNSPIAPSETVAHEAAESAKQWEATPAAPDADAIARANALAVAEAVAAPISP